MVVVAEERHISLAVVEPFELVGCILAAARIVKPIALVARHISFVEPTEQLVVLVALVEIF